MNSKTTWILAGLVVGILAGLWVHSTGADPNAIAWLDVPSKIFLNLVKCIVAPLIVAMLVVGVAGARDLGQLGRLGLRTFVYFLVVTTVAMFVGLFAVNLAQPGVGVNLPAETGKAAADIAANAAKLTPQQHLINIVPTSVIKAAADNEVLPLVVFSLMFAIAVLLIGEKGKPIVDLCEAIAEAMFVFTGFVMKLAPLGVAAAMAVAVGRSGPAVLTNLLALVLTLYAALAVFLLFVLLPIALWARLPIRRFVQLVREPALLAFTTTSSESALPKALENMERYGVPRRIVSFVIPLGYSFNLDGSTLYLSLAAVFVAQAAGADFGFGEQMLMVATLMLSSKGIAAVPRASLVVLAGTLTSFHLPIEGIALILGVDVLMDMARTATNVIGNCLASAVMARWEGVLAPPEAHDAGKVPDPAPK
ncbi:MAG TPA: dicarboxylate/amino acid:cation symporter [Planctomycetota bacterium]|nr:dicarboxylate/amino acid:cation symporter [Planctomycetota bacterium]